MVGLALAARSRSQTVAERAASNRSGDCRGRSPTRTTRKGPQRKRPDQPARRKPARPTGPGTGTSTPNRSPRSLPRLGNLRWDRIALALFLYAIALVPPAMLLRTHCMPGPTGGAKHGDRRPVDRPRRKVRPGQSDGDRAPSHRLGERRVTAVPATVSIFLETFLMMAVGASVAALVMVWLPVPTWMAVASIGVALLASLPTLPPILRQIAKRVTKMDGLRCPLENQLASVRGRLGWSLLSWLLVGGHRSQP